MYMNAWLDGVIVMVLGSCHRFISNVYLKIITTLRIVMGGKIIIYYIKTLI